jgi:hypothetical protein
MTSHKQAWTKGPWHISGPDEFGDFHIAPEGEQLVICCVIQNGFRSREETASSAQFILTAINFYNTAVEALRIIAGDQQCVDNLMSNADVARAALTKAEGGKDV